jgi:chromosome segregation ATPase
MDDTRRLTADELEQELVSLREQLAFKKSYLQKSYATIAQWEQNFAQATMRADSLCEQLAAAQADRDLARREIESTMAAYREVGSELLTAEAENVRLTADWDSLRSVVLKALRDEPWVNAARALLWAGDKQKGE